jgi:hypothetical protein
VAQTGLLLQVDCPSLAMGQHIQFATVSLEEFRNMARLHVNALNHALASIPLSVLNGIEFAEVLFKEEHMQQR